MTRTLYLHGFASGLTSRKATFFREKFEENERELEVPDLAAGDFPNLTISGQLALIERLLDGNAAVLIGSSLGGYLAALYAARHAEVKALLLLAPAFSVHQHWAEALGPEELQHWKETGEKLVYHYGEKRMAALGYGFMAEAGKFEPFPEFSQPCLICHGEQDDVVPISYSESFTRNHANVTLVRLQSGHELTDVLENIWELAGTFLLEASGN